MEPSSTPNGRRTTEALDRDVETDTPGTVHLIDLDGSMQALHDKSLVDVVLYPTPSSDPEDPLNWSYKRKWLNSFCLQLYTFMIAGGTATGYAVYPEIIQSTNIPLATLNSAIGVMFLLLGWGCLFWCPIGLQFGRRGVYLVSILGCMAMNLWAPYTTSTGTWYVHRFLYGFFGAPVEALVEQSIPDMFFVHERGLHIGMFLMWLGGASFLFPIAAGFVAQTMDWKWCFYFPSIFMAATFIILFFFMDETMYDRGCSEGLAQQPSGTAGYIASQAPQKRSILDPIQDKDASLNSAQDIELNETMEVAVFRYETPTYWHKLRLFRTVPRKDILLWTMMTRPLMHVWNFPIMTMAGFQYGSYLMMFLVLNATWTTILQNEQYHFSTSFTGVLYVSPFIGALFGSLYSGRFADWFHLWCARRNKGIREPEQRLWLYLATTISTVCGLLLWGVGSAQKIHWFGPVFGAGLMGFAGVLAGASSIAYISESYPKLTGEGMITMTLIRNTMGFAMGYVITPWFESSGIQNTFIALSVLSVALTGMFYPFIYFGKSERKRTAAKYRKYAATATMTH